MFEELERINAPPEPFEFYTAGDLWTDAHTSARMLAFHLDGAIDLSSRNAAFIARSVEWIALRFTIDRQSAVVDFGCGPGLYATPLAKRGANVTGIDFSGRSIDYAKEVAAHERLRISCVKQNYLSFETEDRFNLVLMIMCDFCALSPTQRGAVLDNFHTILKPGGSVLLDVYSLAAFDQRAEAATFEMNLLDGFWSPDRYYGFITPSNTMKRRWCSTSTRLSRRNGPGRYKTGCNISPRRIWKGSLARRALPSTDFIQTSREPRMTARRASSRSSPGKMERHGASPYKGYPGSMRRRRCGTFRPKPAAPERRQIR